MTFDQDPNSLRSSSSNIPRRKRKPIAVLVLGMHRSGTSAFTRTLNYLGAELPKNLLGPHPSNEAGHWEPRRLVELHDNLLSEHATSWYDLRPFQLTKITHKRRNKYKNDLKELIRGEFDNTDLIVLKEPRISKFAGEFIKILEELGFDVRCIIAIRNPLSVTASINVRDNISYLAGLNIWLRYNFDAERYTRGISRVFVSYENLLNNWKKTVKYISSAISLQIADKIEISSKDIESFLNDSLQHQKASLSQLKNDHDIPEIVKNLYEILIALEKNGENKPIIQSLEELYKEYSSAVSIIGEAVFQEIRTSKRLIAQSKTNIQDNIDLEVNRKYKNLLSKSTNIIKELESYKKKLKYYETKIEINKQTYRNSRKKYKEKITGYRDKLHKLEDEHEVAKRKNYNQRLYLNELQNKMSETTEKIKRESSKEVEKLQKQVEANHFEIGYLINKIDAIHASTSWKITKPIRRIRIAGNQIKTVLKYIYRMFRERNLDWQTIKTGARRLPGLLRGGKLAVPSDFTSMIELFEPSELERLREGFDQKYYLENNPDIQISKLDPFTHFMNFGWREHRDPSADFSVSHYLRRYPEIEKGGINPYVHFILFGKSERRSTLPFHERMEKIKYAPKIVAIVPNYNHGKYLRKRIESLTNQTYENIEIVILDDCSVDDSISIIEEYCQLYPDRVKGLFNHKNSGNVFRQWRKGIECADCDLIWVCESDDYCELDFAERMVAAFRDPSVSIAFGRIQFCDADGGYQAGLDRYREGAEPGVWNNRLRRPANEWFAKAFGVNNIIANVGGCMWRSQKLSEDVWAEAERFTVLGDWYLYSQIAGGGQIVFEPSAVAYFRQHGANTSVTSFSNTQYYVEHKWLMTHLKRMWAVPAETVDQFYSKIEYQYQHFRLKSKHGPLERYVDLAELRAVDRNREHILIAILGFEWGGGEVFPINLANALKARGQLVSVLAYSMYDVKKDLMRTLDPAIAVYDGDWVAEIGADRFIETAGITLIHSHMISLDHFFFVQQKIRTKVPYLVTLHGSYDSGQLSDNDLAAISRGVTRWVYTAEKNLAALKSANIPKSKFVKMANAMPVDDLPFDKSRAQLGISQNAVVFTLVARGIPQKGWRTSILAFRQLKDAFPNSDLHLLLCGDGEQTQICREEFGDEPNVTFLGYQPRIHGLYRLTDCAIVPTRFSGESYPLCIIQALQCGTPVIASRVGEIHSMLCPDNVEPGGILIEPDRNNNRFVDNLIRAMTEMLDASTRNRCSSAAKKLGESYSMEKAVCDYLELYDKVIEEN